MNILGMLQLMKELLYKSKEEIEVVLFDILPVMHHFKDENRKVPIHTSHNHSADYG